MQYTSTQQSALRHHPKCWDDTSGQYVSSIAFTLSKVTEDRRVNVVNLALDFQALPALPELQVQVFLVH
ncbi:hypothetical protein NDU88_003535 [Pleurodeles waltl]|uniref:Uncharacterized protein n=1 Tax=Pleurodeles waltl TaxID=8319 RepID=A0AAV7RH05_PLEWA|nr:hypothetical protein NDU88_003535 [Pleurodeles waltl]